MSPVGRLVRFQCRQRGQRIGLATSAFVATHFGAAAAALGWMFAEWIRHGKPSMLGGISGCVAGLVAITPASGFVQPFPAPAHRLHRRHLLLLYGDNGQEPFRLRRHARRIRRARRRRHARCDTHRYLRHHLVNDGLKDAAGKTLPLGWIDGNPHQILNQLAAVIISWVLAAVATLLILKFVDLTIGVRATTDQEREGLDLAMHGEEGYNFES